MDEPSDVSFDERLAAARAACTLETPDYDAEVDRFVARLASGKAGASAPHVGEPFPDLALPDHGGRIRRVLALGGGRPLALQFLRGSWCDFCDLSMRALAAAAPTIRAVGGEVVAIAPQRAVHARRQLEDAGADFPMLIDVDLAAATMLGLTVAIDAALEAHLRGFGIDLAAINGADGGLLPIPAAFVIAADGTVAYRHVDADPRRRAAPEALAQAVAAAVSAGAGAGSSGAA